MTRLFLLLYFFAIPTAAQQPHLVAGSINGLPNSGIPNIPAGQDNTIVVQVQNTGGIYAVGLTISQSWYTNYSCIVDVILPNFPNLSTSYMTLITDHGDQEPAMSFGGTAPGGGALTTRNSACTLSATPSSISAIGNNTYQDNHSRHLQ